MSIDGVTVFDNDDFSADFVISMGGDGTFLRAASMVAGRNIPILGINTGRLGFLADVNAQEIERDIQALYEGDYTIDTRSVIQVETVGQPLKGYHCALNDVAILKRDNASMITIHARINGDELVTYQADGLVVSTPTGSTAYNLSNGGPIMAPLTGILCLTPVAPHSLNIRPIVINDDSVIELTVESRTHNYLVAVDGRSATLDERIPLVISKAPYTVRIVKRASQHYFATLREKMMWGMDAR
jgi:NAD+ kinase